MGRGLRLAEFVRSDDSAGRLSDAGRGQSAIVIPAKAGIWLFASLAV